MKKQILMLCMIFISASTFAQMTTKNGHTILPEEGDWAIQMNAVPLVNMALNAMDIMNDNGNNAAHPGYVSGFSNVIVGKYFHDANHATRVKISIETSTLSDKNFGDDPTTTDSFEDDVHLSTDKYSYWSVMVGYGKEYRRGHNRLQGFYGYEGLLGLSSGEFDEEFEEGTNTSTNYQFDTSEWGVGSYDISSNDGLGIALQARAFVGVEYFAAPKISIGAEFGWGFGLAMMGRGSMTHEEVEMNDEGNLTTTTIDMSGDYAGTEFGFDVDNMNAALTATFHF
jgi:hypothetical protein